jgi:hypothetical protein
VEKPLVVQHHESDIVREGNVVEKIIILNLKTKLC